MPAIRAQFPELFQLGLEVQTQLALLDELTDMNYDEFPSVFESIYKVSDGTGTGESNTAVGNYGLPQKQDGELGGIHYDEHGKWFPQNYIFAEWNSGYIISHQIQRDDRWGLAQHRAKSFGRSFRRLFEVLGARVFNEGFSLQTASDQNEGRRSPDGKALFATDHPMPGPQGGTQANKSASGGADLAHPSLEAMIIRMGNRTDDRGMPVNIPLRTLLVPWELEYRAREILHSQYRTDGGVNRVKNVLSDDGAIEIKASRFLTNKRAWFGIGPKSMTSLKWIWRERFTRLMWKDNESRAIHVGGWESFDFGWDSFYGLDGDAGLGG